MAVNPLDMLQDQFDQPPSQHDWRKQQLYDALDRLNKTAASDDDRQLLADYLSETAPTDNLSREHLRDRFIRGNVIKRYSQLERLKYLRGYINEPDRLPCEYRSNADAAAALTNAANAFKAEQALLTQTNIDRVKLGIEEAVNILLESGIALTRNDESRSQTLYVYDYDRRLYTTDMHLIDTWLAAIVQVVTPTLSQSFIKTLSVMPNCFAKWCPLPSWLIPVGNGLYDCLNRELLPDSVCWTVLRRVKSNYVHGIKEPKLLSGMSFERLVNDLANNEPDRALAIKQLCKTIIIGHAPKPACFLIIGRGGDGKSLFMQLMSYIVGQANVGVMSIKDLNRDDVIHANADASLVVGFDNDARAVFSDTSMFKSLVLHEPITVSRKYLSAATLTFQGTLVQLCNAMPRVLETGSSIRRRLVAINAENSHYEKSDELTDLSTEITDSQWHDYILTTLLDETATPFYTDYNDFDASTLNESLDADDLVTQFINTLYENAIITDATQYVPLSLMYAAYCDWMKTTNPNSGKLGSRAFLMQFRRRMSLAGFDSASASQQLMLKTAVTSLEHVVNFEMLKPLQGSAVADLSEQDSTTTQLLVRAGPDRRDTLNLSSARHSEVCTAVDYFGVQQDAATSFELASDLYRDLLDGRAIDEPMYQAAAASDNDMPEPESDRVIAAHVAQIDLAATDNETVAGSSPDEDPAQQDNEPLPVVNTENVVRAGSLVAMNWSQLHDSAVILRNALRSAADGMSLISKAVAAGNIDKYVLELMRRCRSNIVTDIKYRRLCSDIENVDDMYERLDQVISVCNELASAGGDQ